LAGAERDRDGGEGINNSKNGGQRFQPEGIVARPFESEEAFPSLDELMNRPSLIGYNFQSAKSGFEDVRLYFR
jgi:hypothetical protein